MITRLGTVALLCVLVVACQSIEVSSPTVAVEKTLVVPPTHTTESSPAPQVTEPSTTPIPSTLPSASSTPTREPLTATSLPEPNLWHSAGTLALFVRGDDEQADLFSLVDDGTTRLVFPDVGREARVSRDGRWLGFIRWYEDGRSTLELHDAQSGEVREIAPDTASGLFSYSFDPESRRLAYLDLGDYTDAGVPWALVIVDLEGGATARHDAFMAGPDTRPLPGMPIGWSGHPSQSDELIIDTFLPYTEGGWMGMWGVTLPADGTSAPLESLVRRELIPAAPVYSSRPRLAPDGQDVAYLGRNPDYVPDNYHTEFYDLAVNRLGIASLADGARTTIVDIDDGSALTRAFSWSPTGERLLFAQGRYEGEDFANLVLKSSDRSGTTVTYGPLMLPPLGGILDLAWCDSSRAIYVTWDGVDGTERLVSFDLNTGVSTEISAGRRLQIVGCAPE